MFNLRRYKTFESYTVQDLKFDPSIIDRLLDVSKRKIIEDYWIEQGEILNPAKTDPDHPNDAYLDEQPVAWDGPVLKIKLEDDQHVYTFDQFDEKALLNFIDNVEHNSVHIPREEIESIKEVILLIKEGWDLFHVAENRSNFILSYKLGDKQWIVGLSFRKKDGKINVTLKSNLIKSKMSQYKLQKDVLDESEAIQTAKIFMKDFYTECWLKKSL